MKESQAHAERQRLMRQRRQGVKRFLDVTIEQTGAVFPNGEREVVIYTYLNPELSEDDVYGAIYTPGHESKCECNTCQFGVMR
jgi:hypothetical protein